MIPILKTWLRKLANARDVALDFWRALLEDPPAPNRVCRRCFVARHDVRDGSWVAPELHAARALLHTFEDSGACSRCGEVAEPADSVAVEPHR